MTVSHTIFNPPYSKLPGQRTYWGQLYASSSSLALHNCVTTQSSPLLVITPDMPNAYRIEQELKFYRNPNDRYPVHIFPDWETLPYDAFSPHQDIISDRLAILYQLPTLRRGVVIVPVSTLMHRLAPRQFLEAHALMIQPGQHLQINELRERLTRSSYSLVSQVMEHGEFAVRGSIIDLFPMGAKHPYRIDLFDDEIESIRSFDPETQRSLKKHEHIRLLPAREFPLTEESIKLFRQAHRAAFEGDPNSSMLYRDISNGITPQGIEYYLPLFFQHTDTLFDYLADDCVLVSSGDTQHSAEIFWHELSNRFEQGRYDLERPILPPQRIALQVNELNEKMKQFAHISLQPFKFENTHKAGYYNFHSSKPAQLPIDARADQPAAKLKNYIDDFDGKILFAAESAGRRETLLEILKSINIHPKPVDSWQAFLDSEYTLGIFVSPLEHGLLLNDFALAVIAETQLFGEQVLQQRRRKAKQRDPNVIIKNLVELREGSPVVHEEHGVGRYLGLQTIKVGELQQEFLSLEYAGHDKLYVPVSSLHLISRYTGASPDAAPLHKLGSGQWEKAKRKAREKVRDVAAELLEIYARREAREGHSYTIESDQYKRFASTFPFEETPDQLNAISGIIADMKSKRPMDRLVCGDVGFGKTEVAMRAAFIAIQDDKQVAMLVPTTLLAQQHYENFKDRFSEWPIKVESISRFRSKKDQDEIIKGLKDGKIDIIIGTHKLIQNNVKFKRLGLVIIDEEHRFGVRQKERFKALRSEVDLLTLTATPIPRTLNMSLSGLRDLSIIATAPAKRLAIRTFVNQWNNIMIQEACMREIRRGGQVFFLHNEVQTIDKTASRIQQLIPDAQIRVAHGQMRERDLERVMADFYHQRFNILLCTTIIETGIDVPSANTIIINRADRFGLAQLYQLRGRVGRSHHQAYAYLITPPRQSMTADAIKRLEAIESMEDLGTGFTLATHDLEIRGAGELLGDEQSGNMHEIGFHMYMELLERAVESLKRGEQIDLDDNSEYAAEVDLNTSAIIPEDYLPDVHSRLIMYKRIANAKSDTELRELQVEMIDRFGLLPDPTKNLFTTTGIKLQATPLGITKIELSEDNGRITFNKQPNIDPGKIINLIQTQPNTFKLDGMDKLRIIRNMPDIETRANIIKSLLKDLSA